MRRSSCFITPAPIWGPPDEGAQDELKTSDFDYELQMAQTNRKLNPDVDTMFLATSLEYAYLSSTTVKEVASFGGDLREFVPECIIGEIRQKINEQG